MNNRTKQQQNVDENIPERPLDPSRDYSDMIGDTSGLTGMTTGSAAQSSAEPDDITDVDSAHLPGGIIQNGKQTQPTGIPKTAISDKVYNQSIPQTMSSTAAQAADDIASDGTSGAPSSNPADDQMTDDSSKTVQQNPQMPDEDTASSDQPITQIDDATSPAIQGEQAVSGDMPDVESDDDTLGNAHAVGTQLDEDLEHPQELDIARDMDAAEENIRTH